MSTHVRSLTLLVVALAWAGPVAAQDPAPVTSTYPVNVRPHLRVAAPVVVDNLTAWPLLSDAVKEVGRFVSLEEALRRKSATVKEVKSGQVGKLEVDNKGMSSILITAGTVLKGGKQDRQIGEDLVVPPRTKTRVTAFCVEAGRWKKKRSMYFSCASIKAPSGVRAEGQYGKDQSKVWEAVSAANAAAGKKRSSLLASLEDDDLGAASLRKRVQRTVEDHFRQAARRTDGWGLVGFAYAVDGQARNVRTFARPELLESHLEPFLNTMALEAYLAQRRRKALDQKRAPPPAFLSSLLDLIQDPLQGSETIKKRAANTNVYREGNLASYARCEVQVGLGKATLTEDWTPRVTRKKRAPAPQHFRTREE